MKEIKTFKELMKIENKKVEEAIRLDLLLILKGYRLIDGIVFILGADCKQSIELLYMEYENYNLLNQNEKEYIKNEYLFNN